MDAAMTKAVGSVGVSPNSMLPGEAGQREGGGSADRDARAQPCRRHRAGRDRSSRGVGPEGHAHAELVRPPRHLKRQQAEQADGRNDEREHTEQRRRGSP